MVINEDKNKLAIGLIILLSIISGYIFSARLLNAIATGEVRIVFKNWWLLVLAVLPPSALLIWQFRKTLSSSFERVGVGLKIGLLLLLLLIGWFYWFQYRSTKIRAMCHEEIFRTLSETPREKLKLLIAAKEGHYLYNNLYQYCLHEHGIER